jgi:hypothetical protein
VFFLVPSGFQKYLLAYDTVHGRFRGTIEVNEKGHLVVDGHEITVWSEYVSLRVFVCVLSLATHSSRLHGSSNDLGLLLN